jgi:peptidoglycan/xylan/chitin deacetylase (PgdA/CDA1 family)
MKFRSRTVATILLAALALLPGAARPASAQGPAPGVPILVYHRFGPTVVDGMTVTTPVLEEQLAWLRDHDYRIVPLRSLVDALEDAASPLPAHAVAITTDDGHRSVHSEMLPLIRRYRFPVTLFIYPSAISNADYALTWEQLREIAATGLVEVQSHTYWHPNFDRERAKLTPDAYRAFVRMQFGRSQEVIARHIGSAVDMLAWPFGIHDEELEAMAARAGYRAAFTLERRHASRASNLLALPRYLITDRDRGARFAAIIESAHRR